MTLLVHEVDGATQRERRGLWPTDQLFSMIDEFSAASLERVDAENDAEFIVELVTTADPDVTNLMLRESILIMTSEQITTNPHPDQWEAIATRFATMIDTAAECYAAPLSTV